jgi:hypothetical protein
MQICGRFSNTFAERVRVPALLVTALAALALSGCSGDEPTTNAVTTTPTATGQTTTAGDAPQTVTVLGSAQNTGPFEDSLSLKLVAGFRPIPFYVCAAWGAKTAPSNCTAAQGARLPAGSTLRLEQRPPGPAVTYPDSPGWGTVGTSEDPELNIPLSNGVTGNRVGKVTFRATLRNRSGRVLATSNTFTLTWRR